MPFGVLQAQGVFAWTPSASATAPKVATSSIGNLTDDADHHSKNEDLNHHIFKSIEQKKAADEIAQQAFLDSCHQIMHEQKLEEEVQTERQSKEDEKPKDAVIEKITLGTQINRLQTVLTDALFTKSSSAKYAIAECTKLFDSSRHAGQSLKDALQTHKVAFDNAIAPAETDVDGKIKILKAYMETNHEEGHKLSRRESRSLPP